MPATIVRVHMIIVCVHDILNTLARSNFLLTDFVVDNDQRQPSSDAASCLNVEWWRCAGQGEVYYLRTIYVYWINVCVALFLGDALNSMETVSVKDHQNQQSQVTH